MGQVPIVSFWMNHTYQKDSDERLSLFRRWYKRSPLMTYRDFSCFSNQSRKFDRYTTKNGFTLIYFPIKNQNFFLFCCMVSMIRFKIATTAYFYSSWTENGYHTMSHGGDPFEDTVEKTICVSCHTAGRRCVICIIEWEWYGFLWSIEQAALISPGMGISGRVDHTVYFDGNCIISRFGFWKTKQDGIAGLRYSTCF